MFDEKSWHEINTDYPEQVTGGKVHVKADAPVTVWLFHPRADGKAPKKGDPKVIVGHGLEVRARIAGVRYMMVTGAYKFAQFYDVLSPTIKLPNDAEIYTNADRQPSVDPETGEVIIDPFEGSMRLRRLAEMQERRATAAQKARLRQEQHDADMADKKRLDEAAAAEAAEEERLRLEAVKGGEEE